MTEAVEIADWTYLDIGEVVVTGTDNTVAVLPEPDDRIGELLAAAPVLRSALANLLAAVEHDKCPGLGLWTDAARSALACCREAKADEPRCRGDRRTWRSRRVVLSHG